jgi:ComF family protein
LSLQSSFAGRLSGYLLDLIFPADCLVCGAPHREGKRYPVCTPCLSAVEPLHAEYLCSSCGTPFLNQWPLDEEGCCALCRLGIRGFDGAFSFGSYEGALRRLIHLFKYEGIRPLAAPLGRLLSHALPRDREFDAVVAMPMHWRRRWRRGFNQSELLAREIARRIGKPVLCPVHKRKNTSVQAGLTSAARRRNVSGAFTARPGDAVRGKRVLLVDDVLTTGATAAACAAAIRRAGAASVTLLTVARADRRLGRERLLALTNTSSRGNPT